MAGANPNNLAALPVEPGQPDFARADIENGAVAVQFRGERLFINANYNRDTGLTNGYARIHHVTQSIDREGVIKMPTDATSVQDDGNLSGDSNHVWIVRFGKYLIVLNRSQSSYLVHLPEGSGNAYAIQLRKQIPMGTTSTVAGSSYDVFVMDD